MHRRNFARFIGDALSSPDALPCYVSLTRLRDRANVIVPAKDVDILIAANYLPPFYTNTPQIDGERYGDGGVTDNAPYEFALSLGCDAVVLMTVKGESEGGIYKNAFDTDHEIPENLRERVVVIRPRHRLPYSFTERRWQKLSELIHLGDLRTREVLLGERHPETEISARGASPSARLMRLWRLVSPSREPARGSVATAADPEARAPR